MWAYFLRRLLLMIPTLFGISLFNFVLINAAEAPRAQSVSEDGTVDASASVEAGEARCRPPLLATLTVCPQHGQVSSSAEEGAVCWRVPPSSVVPPS